MDFNYGLIVILAIFEGIRIQCEDAGAKDSLNGRQNAPTIDISENELFLSNDLKELIVGKTDFKTIKLAVRWGIVYATDIITNRILQNCLIFIAPSIFCGRINEYYRDGDLLLDFGKYNELISFFERFGDKVKKIEFWYENYFRHNEITKNIIKRYAKNFEELRLNTLNDDSFWQNLLDGENGIIFAEVKKFQFVGYNSHNKFDLNLIFPKLESFKLSGCVFDVNCLANVKKLKELTLNSVSIKEHQLKDIFANNQNIKKIFLLKPKRTETMQLIARYLTKLETLEVESPGGNFLLQKNDNPVYKLPSVTHFNIEFDGRDEMDKIFGIGNRSFDMPRLTKLTLNGDPTDDRIVNFIRQFEKLEIVELFSIEYDTVKFIRKLEHIKEITTIFYKNGFVSVKNLFRNFDKKSKLQTLKFVNADSFLHRNYEDAMKEINEDIMKEINIDLEQFMKPTWTLSHGEHIETGKKYVIFRRDPCNCKFCKK